MEASGVIPIPSLSNIGFEDTDVLKVLQSPFFVAASLISPLPLALTLIGAGSGVIKNMTGAGDVNQEHLSQAIKLIKFSSNEKPSGITSTFDVTALTGLKQKISAN